MVDGRSWLVRVLVLNSGNGMGGAFGDSTRAHIPSLTVSNTSSVPLRPFPSATVSLNLYIPSTRLDSRSTT